MAPNRPASRENHRLFTGPPLFNSPYIDASEHILVQEASELQICLRGVDTVRDVLQLQGGLPPISLHNRVEESLVALDQRVELPCSVLVRYVALRVKQLLGEATLRWLNTRTFNQDRALRAYCPGLAPTF